MTDSPLITWILFNLRDADSSSHNILFSPVENKQNALWNTAYECISWLKLRKSFVHRTVQVIEYSDKKPQASLLRDNVCFTATKAGVGYQNGTTQTSHDSPWFSNVPARWRWWWWVKCVCVYERACCVCEKESKRRRRRADAGVQFK